MQWKTLLDEAKQTTTGFENIIEQIDQELVAHADRIHETVNEALGKVRRELKEICENQKIALQSQENAINDKYEELKKYIKQLEEYVESNDISLLEHKLDIADMKVLPTLSQQSLPSYTPGQIENQTITTMIGKLNISIQNCTHEEPPQQALASFTPLLSTPVVVSSFPSGYNHSFIACTSSGLAWVKTGEHCIQLMDHDGAVLDKIHTDFEFSEVTISSQGHVLFSDHRESRIVAVSKGATTLRIKPLFCTQYMPGGICSLPNNDVIVTYFWENRVIQYSYEGDIIHEFDTNWFRCPCRVAVNKVNGDLYFIVTHKLLAFDKDHGLRYEYRGSDASSFDPKDVTTDIGGRVLIADECNNRIQVLDKDGMFLQYIQPRGLKKPKNIDVDNDGHVWIVERNGQLKIVKY